MKKYTWLLFILYFGVFVAFGLIFYFKYLDRFFKSGSEPITVETAKSQEYIYYSQENNLYRLNPELALDPESPERNERIQSTGPVSNLDIYQNGSLLAYEVQVIAGKEIWQVKTATNESQKIAYQDAPNLEGFKDFSAPKFSPDGIKLAFIASGSTDTIIIQNLSNLEFFHLTDKFATKIADFTWTSDSEKIVFCTKGLASNLCYLVDVASGSDQKIIDGEVTQISQSTDSAIIYLIKEAETANLFRYNLKTSSADRLTDLKAPKKVSRFSTDKKGEKIAYEVNSEGQSDLYFVGADGANRIQLTTDSKTTNPVFQGAGQEIGFIRAGDAVYTINFDKTNEQKIVNLEGSVVKLLLWR